MDLATLKALKPTEYSEAADGYRSTSDMASAAKDRIENQIAVAMRNSLKGEAATAVVKQLMELGKNFHYIQVECGLVSTALEAFSYEWERPRASSKALGRRRSPCTPTVRSPIRRPGRKARTAKSPTAAR